MRKRTFFELKFLTVLASLAWLAAPAGASPPSQPIPPPLESQTIDAAKFEGMKITGVRLLDESGNLLEDAPEAAGVKPGAAYDSPQIRRALRQLHATGRFAEIRVEATPEAAGVRLDFIVSQNLFVNQVRIQGLRNERLTSRALASLQLNLGDVFSESKLEQAKDRLLETLTEEGLYEAQVNATTDPHPSTRQMDITFQARQGPRSRIGALTISNLTAFPDDVILDKSSLEPDQTLNPRRLERARERLRKYLSKKGYLGARVITRRGNYDSAKNRVALDLEVVAGARVSVEVKGADISQKQVRELIPIYQEGTVDEDLLQEGRRNLRSFLERRGYFDATVGVSEREDAKSQQHVITYTVQRGQRQRLVDVGFEGNNFFSGTTLREQLAIRPAAFLDRGIFSRRILENDVERLKALYVSNGFQDAVVTSEIVPNYQGDKENIFVRFTIAEGKQARVAELVIEGTERVDYDRIQSVASSQPGQAYSEANVATDRDNILTIYFSEGFTDARFDYKVEPSKEADRVKLTYRIIEGPQTRVDRVLINGNEFTRTDVIKRELEVYPEEPYRLGGVVESQRRLYNLGIFNRVQIAPQNPEGTEHDKTVVVLVDEARRYTMAYGGGIEFQRLGSGDDPTADDVRASPRGLFEISKANFWGRAHTVSFKARASTLQGRALLSYAAPNFFGNRKYSFLLTTLADKTSDVRTFTSRRYEASAQIDHQSSRATTFLYRYFFRKVLVDASSLRIDPQQVPLFSQPTLISGFGASWIRDRRDNPAEAQRGNFNTADVSFVDRRLGSSASFVRFVFQNSTFHRVTRTVTFARSARFGLQEPFSNTASQEVPLPERFFAGGGQSLRGFALNQAGPRDPSTGFPLGGLAQLVLNNELRFPMRLPKLGDKVGGAIFYDGGNVYSRLDDITFRATPASPSDLNFFSHTIGFGFRYATPIGPVRVDLGYLLNSPQFTVTDSTTGVTSLTRLSRFQFSLNIGSIF